MYNIPLDLKAETLLCWLPRDKRVIELKGSHRHNAYEDIAAITEDENGLINIAIARNGLYDILPESLFHPIDRFDNIPANEYKEKFKEECEQQQIEEDNARRYFRPFDNLLLELSAVISGIKNDIEFSGILGTIIFDNLPDKYLKNRFVKKTKEYMPLCNKIRGNKSLFILMLRRILFDEQVRICESQKSTSIIDRIPRYNCRLEEETSLGGDFYLGNLFDEDILTYDIQYWNDDECGENFLEFVREMEVFEDFLNAYFMSIESHLKFNISTITLPLRLSDDIFHTFLDYNTNI